MATSLNDILNIFKTDFTSSVFPSAFSYSTVLGYLSPLVSAFTPSASSTTSTTSTSSTPAITIEGSQFGFSNLSSTQTVTFIAHAAFNTIRALGGDDLIYGGGFGFTSVDTGTGNCTVYLGGLYNKLTGGDGSNKVFSTSGLASITLGNGANTLSISGPSNQITLGNGNNTVGYSGAYNKITLGSGNNTIFASHDIGNASITTGAGTEAITLGGSHNNVTLKGSSATLTNVSGGDQINATGGHDSFTLNGLSNHVSLAGLIDAAIIDQGQSLQLDIKSSNATVTMSGLASDTSALISLMNGAGGYTSTAQIMSALQSDGHGGTMLSLGSSGSIDFLNTAPSQIHASNFRIA